MLSSLIVLSTLLAPQSASVQGESLFPKPEARRPSVLSDKTIFQYRKGDEMSGIGFLNADWSALKIVELKPSAAKLKVLLLVLERDFSNPEVSNTLEMTDKQRLIATMSRIRSYFSSSSNGDIDLEVIPRFVPEPIFKPGEARELIDMEFNRYKFDADDKEERGPFAATIVVSSSKNSVPDTLSFSELGGSAPDSSLEVNLIQKIVQKLSQNVVARPVQFEPQSTFTYPNGWPVLRKGISPMFLDPTFRDDLGQINASFEGVGPRVEPSTAEVQSEIAGPITVTNVDGAMVYTESSIFRGGAIPLTKIPVGTFEFKVRTKSLNPLAIYRVSQHQPDKFSEAEVTFGARGAIKVNPDGSWQTVRIANSQEAGFVYFLGCPQRSIGVTRSPHEVIRYEFKDFRMTTESPSPIAPQQEWDFTTEVGLSQALSSGDLVAQRKALRAVIVDPKFKSLQPKMLELASELDASVASAAVTAYGALGIESGDLIAKTFLTKMITSPTNEYAREAALDFFAKNPNMTTFESVAPNIVRRSWRVRLAAVRALAALDQTELKAKPAARQLLLTACSQDMAIIRASALRVMKTDVDAERKQLEYSMVNDPSEQIRLLCLERLGQGGASKDLLFGSLADDSPYIRESMAERIPISFRREALQRMVIDRDVYVRAAALRQFADLQDPTQVGEIQNTFSDEHPAILLALIDGGLKGKWTLPGEVIQKALACKNSGVRESAAKLAKK